MDLKIVIAEGEGYYVEFKERISGLDREIVSFANASGGRVYLGIRDGGEIVGYKLTNRERSIISDIARNCDPSIDVRIEDRDDIAVIHVPEGDRKPYKCAGGYYIRNGASSQKMDTDELIEFIQKEQRYNFDEQYDSRYPENDFDRDKYQKLIRKCKISEEYKPEDVMVNLGMASYKNNKFILNNTGILFLGRSPERFIPHLAITCVLYKGKIKLNVLDRKDYTSDLISNIENAIIFLKRHLNLSYEITGLRRKEILQLPETALREAIVNAVAHRDYFVKGANIFVELFDNRLDISSPGGLPAGLKIEDLGKKSVLRNPLIASILLRADYIEKLGTGINRIQKALKKTGNLKAEFAVDSFFTISFPIKIRVNEGTSDEIEDRWSDEWSERWSKELTDRQYQLLSLICKNPKITRKKLTEIVGINSSAIQKNIEVLKGKGILIRIGAARGGYWKIVKG